MTLITTIQNIKKTAGKTTVLNDILVRLLGINNLVLLPVIVRKKENAF